MSFVEYSLAISGSLFAIFALAVGLLERFSGGTLLRAIRPAVKKIRFRPSKSLNDNHRHAWFVISTTLLFVLSVIRGNPVYIGLEVLLIVSTGLWYLKVHRVERRSDECKEWARIVLALGIWAFLEYRGLVPGFHKIGVVGLELLGCAFVVSRWELLREILQLLGGLAITFYAAVGLWLDPERTPDYVIWGSLNAIFSLFAIILLFGPKSPSCDPEDSDPAK